MLFRNFMVHLLSSTPSSPAIAPVPADYARTWREAIHLFVEFAKQGIFIRSDFREASFCRRVRLLKPLCEAIRTATEEWEFRDGLRRLQERVHLLSLKTFWEYTGIEMCGSEKALSCGSLDWIAAIIPEDCSEEDAQRLYEYIEIRSFFETTCTFSDTQTMQTALDRMNFNTRMLLLSFLVIFHNRTDNEIELDNLRRRFLGGQRFWGLKNFLLNVEWKEFLPLY